MNNPFFYMSLIAFGIKLWAGYRLRLNIKTPDAKPILELLLFVIYFQTFLELYGYFVHSQNRAISTLDIQFFKFYYVHTVAFLILIPVLFLTIIKNQSSALISICGVLAFAIMTVMIYHPDFMIAGVEKTPYSYTRVKGDYYWAFVFFCLLMLTLTILMLYHSYRYANNELAKVKSVNLMISFIPFMIGLSTIIVAVHIGTNIYTIGFFPTLLCVLICSITINLREDRVIDLRAFIPGTKKSKMAWRIIKPLREVTRSTECKNYLETYEDTLTEIANKQFDKTSDRIKWLGISKPTYYKRIRKGQHEK